VRRPRCTLYGKQPPCSCKSVRAPEGRLQAKLQATGHVHTNARTHTCTRMHAHAHAHARTHMHTMYTHTHARIHTHAHLSMTSLRLGELSTWQWLHAWLQYRPMLSCRILVAARLSGVTPRPCAAGAGNAHTSCHMARHPIAAWSACWPEGVCMFPLKFPHTSAHDALSSFPSAALCLGPTLQAYACTLAGPGRVDRACRQGL